MKKIRRDEELERKIYSKRKKETQEKRKEGQGDIRNDIER